MNIITTIENRITIYLFLKEYVHFHYLFFIIFLNFFKDYLIFFYLCSFYVLINTFFIYFNTSNVDLTFLLYVYLYFFDFFLIYLPHFCIFLTYSLKLVYNLFYLINDLSQLFFQILYWTVSILLKNSRFWIFKRKKYNNLKYNNYIFFIQLDIIFLFLPHSFTFFMNIIIITKNRITVHLFLKEYVHFHYFSFTIFLNFIDDFSDFFDYYFFYMFNENFFTHFSNSIVFSIYFLQVYLYFSVFFLIYLPYFSNFLIYRLKSVYNLFQIFTSII